MKIDLKKYMNHRDEIRKSDTIPGPIVTLSRAYGCPSNKVTIKLIKKIAEWKNEYLADCTWKYINKEIIDEASEELKIPGYQIEKRLSEEAQPIFGLLSGLSKYYVTDDDLIIEKLRSILLTYASRGNTIIVGRGAAQLMQNIEKSIHIRLDAPIHWRAKQIAAQKQLDKDTAIGLIEKIDKERTNFKEKISGLKYTPYDYDIIFNCERLNEDQIVEMIFQIMREKSFLSKKQEAVLSAR